MAVEFPAVTLARYAQRIGYRDCAFFGVRHPDNANYACREIWTQQQRDDIQNALLMAQQQIEERLGYYLRPRWVTGERHLLKSRLVQSDWCHVVAGGVMSDTVIEAGAAVDYSADPATVTVVGVTCDVSVIHLFHPGSDVEIEPTAKDVTAGVFAASIPWCRLVAEDYWYNTEQGWSYADVATWGTATIDVRCITNDTSTQASLHRSDICDDDCDDVAGTACIYVRNSRLGHLALADMDCGCWSHVELNYYSGVAAVSRIMEDAVIRLAHANMPAEPCGCAVTQRLWQRDRSVPEVLTRERLNCPFGLSDGAWVAWTWVQNARIMRGGMWA